MVFDFSKALLLPCEKTAIQAYRVFDWIYFAFQHRAASLEDGFTI
jgi:hypothetical protein